MSGLIIALAVMRRGDTVGVRGKIVELRGSLVPVTSALPTSVAQHKSLLYQIKLNCTTLLSGGVRIGGSRRNSTERSLITKRGCGSRES